MRIITPVISTISLFLAFSGTALAEPEGLDTARDAVLEGTSVSDEVLYGVEGEVPDEARPAIRRSREESQTGHKEAIEGIDRGDASSGATQAGRGGPPAGAGRR